MKQQIIGLLSQLVLPLLSNVSLLYDKTLIPSVHTNFTGSQITRSSHTRISMRFS
jgi:hypothetical protein